MWKKIIQKDLTKYSEYQSAIPILKVQKQAIKRRMERNNLNDCGYKNTLDNEKYLRKIDKTIIDYEIFIEEMNQYLALLSKREYLVLYHFYINRTEGYIETLCEELALERSQIYRIKDKAILSLSKIIYGRCILE